MTKYFIFIIITLLFTFCKNDKANSTNTNPKIDSSSDFQVGKTSTDTLDTSRNKQGIFTVDNLQFRYSVKETDTGMNCLVEKFDNGKWIKNLSYDYSYRTDSMFQDINNDGCPDIVNNWRNWCEAYLYNKVIKLFDTTSIELEYDRSLIDTSNNIYCNNRMIKETQEASRLYTFKGSKIEVLYSLKFKTKRVPDEDFPIITEFCLYKGDFENKYDSNLIETTKVQNNYEFDYLAFWKSKYKNLLGYR